MFSIRQVGIAGTYTQEFKNLKFVIDNLEKKEAESYITRDFETSETLGKLYCIAALKILKSELYNEYKNKDIKFKEDIMFGEGGCIMRIVSSDDILKYIDQKV